MKILVTGGAGFIGSNYVYTHLRLAPQDDLVVLDALTYSGNRTYLKEAEAKGVRFIQGRVEDRELVYKLFEEERFDAVVHFAAETHVDRSIIDPTLFVQSNVLGTQVLLDACRDLKVHRFHHISTDEVYGDLGYQSSDVFTENSQLCPSNPYSASKAASDMLVMAYRRTYDIAITISRCSNNYGPRQSVMNVIPRFIRLAQANFSLTIHGQGENIRDWLFVEDHCEAIFQILHKGCIGEIYNIAANNEQRNLDLAHTILELLDKPKSLIQHVKDRPGNDMRYALSIEKIQKELGWAPKTSFMEGLQKTIDWYNRKENQKDFVQWEKRTLSSITTEHLSPDLSKAPQAV